MRISGVQSSAHKTTHKHIAGHITHQRSKLFASHRVTSHFPASHLRPRSSNNSISRRSFQAPMGVLSWKIQKTIMKHRAFLASTCDLCKGFCRPPMNRPKKTGNEYLQWMGAGYEMPRLHMVGSKFPGWVKYHPYFPQFVFNHHYSSITFCVLLTTHHQIGSRVVTQPRGGLVNHVHVNPCPQTSSEFKSCIILTLYTLHLLRLPKHLPSLKQFSFFACEVIFFMVAVSSFGRPMHSESHFVPRSLP